MSWFAVDVEANGAVPGLFSMTSFGVVRIDLDLDTTFYAELKPLPDAGCNPDALAVGGMSMDYLNEQGQEPASAMRACAEWLEASSEGRPVLVSDNNMFDGMFMAYYFELAGLDNPFGFSSRRIGDLYAGTKGDARKHADWKSLRTVVHDHNALNDAKGNAGAIVEIARQGLYVPGLTPFLDA